MNPQDSSKKDRVTKAVVASKVISKQGARVTEKVYVLSTNAALKLEIKGELPERKVAS